MKLAPIIVGVLGALTILECTYAYPGTSATVREIEQSMQERQRLYGHRRRPSNGRHQTTEVEDSNKMEGTNAVEYPTKVKYPENEAEDVPILIGDVKDCGTTRIGKTIARVITEQEIGQSSLSGYPILGQLGTPKCKADTCCVWAHILLQLTSLFRGQSGRCNKYTRAAIKLGFHDTRT